MVEIEHYDTPYGQEAMCKECHGDVEWIECTNCENGYSHHDCGEDTCSCLIPEDNILCPDCNGEEGWWICPNCIAQKKKLKNEVSGNSFQD